MKSCLLDLAQYRKNREARTKALNLVKLEIALKTPPVSCDERDRLLNEEHIKSILEER